MAKKTLKHTAPPASDTGSSGVKAPKTSASRAQKIVMQFAMCLVAGAIGIALYAEQNFTPLVALGAAILAYIAFRSLHDLLDTAHKVRQLGARLVIPQTMPAEAPVELSKETAMPRPDAAVGQHAGNATVFLSSEPSRVAEARPAPMHPASMELLKPSGQMTSDLISQALMHDLPQDLPVAHEQPIDAPTVPEPSNVPAVLEKAASPHAARIIDEIAQELSAVRPGFDTLSIDGLARDLEAATRAMESELGAAIEAGSGEDIPPDTDELSPDTALPLPRFEETPARHASQPDDGDAGGIEPVLEKAPELEVNVELNAECAPVEDAEHDAPELDTPALDAPELNTPESDAPALDTPESDATDEQGLQNIIREAISACRAQIYLQPILGLATRKAESFEVLTHLENSRGEVLKPSEFLEEAERAGQIPAIDMAMLARTISVLRKLHASGTPGTMFCNLSIISLSDDEVIKTLLAALESDPDSAKRLVIELTQEAYLAFTSSDREKLARLRELGVRLSMDQVTDAGIFMDALKSRIFAFIKVDAVFFLDKLGSGDDALLPAEILSEATLAGVDLVVEKISTSTDLEQVIEMGAKYGQGHVFSDPRPVKRELLEDAA